MADVSYQISVDEENGWKDALPQYEEIIKSCIAAIKKFVEIEGEVSILLTNDAYIQELNRDYRDKDKPTNVLSFPQHPPFTPPNRGDKGGGLLGDVAIALETMQQEADEQSKTFQDHFCHLFIHSVLHLLGYDHENDEDQKQMEQQEVEILHAMGIEDPYE